MTAYIIRRLLQLPITVLGVTILIFLMLQILSPAERAALYIKDIPKNEGQIERVIKRYGLDKPIYVQYVNWMLGAIDQETGHRVGGVLRGDLGYSRTGREPVIDLLLRRFPATLELAIWSFVPILGIGIWLGILAAVNHNQWFDQLARLLSIVGYSFPTFVFGLLALMFLYAKTGWFPPGRLSDWANQVVTAPGFVQYTHLNSVDSLLNGRLDIFLDTLRHMFLPIITLSYLSWALLLRVTRSSMLEALRQDYVRTARAKGLTKRDVINKHARPNALIPVATIGGLTVVGLLNGVDRKSTRLNSSHIPLSRMPSSA